MLSSKVKNPDVEIIHRLVDFLLVRTVKTLMSETTNKKKAEIKEIIRKLIEKNVSGIYHIASYPEVSRFEFARAILAAMLPEVIVEPCGSDEHPAEAKRPTRSSLSCEKLESENFSMMRPWKESLDEFLKLHGKQLLNEI